jgi:hypothetical protein
MQMDNEGFYGLIDDEKAALAPAGTVKIITSQL